jgi:hypothetical protein
LNGRLGGRPPVRQARSSQVLQHCRQGGMDQTKQPVVGLVQRRDVFRMAGTSSSGSATAATAATAATRSSRHSAALSHGPAAGERPRTWRNAAVVPVIAPSPRGVHETDLIQVGDDVPTVVRQRVQALAQPGDGGEIDLTLAQ